MSSLSPPPTWNVWWSPQHPTGSLGTEQLQDLVDCVLWQATYQAAFHHAGRTRLANLKMGWFQIRLPESHQELWALVVESDLESRILTLLTNIPVQNETIAQKIYNDWRLRGRIEHGYRFDQEQGLDVETCASIRWNECAAFSRWSW